MNRKPNPKFIGAFVTIAVALLFGMIFFFSASRLFSRNEHFILFFDQSVNGLTVGSAVKFRGVPVGSVERIMIRVEGQHPDSTAIPVIIRINRDRLEKDLGIIEELFEPEAIMEKIRAGLFAQLTLESFITGQLFVEFTVDPERSPGLQWNLVGESEYREIPTLSGSLDMITADAVDIINDFSQIDLIRLGENINNVLESLNVALTGLDTAGMSRSVSGAADSVSDLLRSEELLDTLGQIDRALVQLTSTLEGYDLDNADSPLAITIGEWTSRILPALESFHTLSTNLESMTDPEGNTRGDFQTMLRELGRAAKSIRVLTDYLERNPNAFLTGRPE